MPEKNKNLLPELAVSKVGKRKGGVNAKRSLPRY